MYSSSYSTMSHLYLYMTPLFLVMESLSFGAIRRLLVVLPPLKYTCILCLLHIFLRLSLSLLVYGITISVLWLLDVVLVEVLVLVLLLTGTVLSSNLLSSSVKAHIGYMHLDRTSCGCSFYRRCGLEHTVLVLWCSVLTTLYLAEMVWWLLQCRYWSVWVGFL